MSLLALGCFRLNLIIFAKVLDGIFWIWNNCRAALFPTGWANFSVSVGVLESLNQSKI